MSTLPKRFITLDDITLRTGGRAWFENSTWRIHEGEHWAVLGKNGAGKSLLLGAISGRILPGRGEVWYHFACTNPEESYPSDGTIPEDYIACVSAEEQQELAATVAGYYQARWDSLGDPDAPNLRKTLRQMTGRSWKSIREAARMTGLEGLLERHTRELSSGELRKLLLARALLSRPRLLILDDPCAGLDAASRVRLREVINGLMADEAMNVIVAVQRPEEIPEGATHALFVEDGRIRARRGNVRKSCSILQYRRLFRLRKNRAPPKKTVLTSTRRGGKKHWYRCVM